MRPPQCLIRWLTQIRPPKHVYQKPTRVLKDKELAAVCCYFNSQKSASRLRNFKDFHEALSKKIPLLIVELAFGDEAFELSEFQNVLQLRTRNVLWQKERLLAIGINKLVQDGYSKIAWLDADIVMSDPYWPERLAEKLDEVSLVQLFSESVRAEDLGYWLSARKGAVRDYLTSGKIRTRGLSPGYAWAARSEIFRQLPLYDAAILDGGDVAIWLGGLCCPKVSHWRSSIQKIRFFQDLTPGLQKHFLNWAQEFGNIVQGNVGYLDQTIYAMRHGKLANRFYGNRYWRVPGFDPLKHLRLERNGCWAWTPEASAFLPLVDRFFQQREEER